MMPLSERLLMRARLLDLPWQFARDIRRAAAQVDTRRMAETGTGSVPSTGSAVPEGDAP